MFGNCRVKVIIPALNEEQSIGSVLSHVPTWVDEIIVVDNGSTDRTAWAAREAGATVVAEPRRGYGQACLTGIAQLGECDVVVFLDGDFSDHPGEMDQLVEPIAAGHADLVIGSRLIGRRERGSLTPQQHFGNWLACRLIRMIWGVRFTDLGPFRAIEAQALRDLHMRDRNYGWTVEMQVKAARQRLRTLEVPVSYRRRICQSKVSGTIRGVIGAGTKIFGTILVQAFASRSHRSGGGELLIVFTRYPEPGKTKTRLIPALGEIGAASLHRQMVARTLAWAHQLHDRHHVRLGIRFEGGDESLMRTWLGKGMTYEPQGNGDLGERMQRAFADGFAEGLDRVIIVGSDCPGLTCDLARRAFDALHDSDLVLGPARDGGYYLIGLRRLIPELLDDMPWGTNQVYTRAIATAQQLNLSLIELPELDDIDRPEDLPIWEDTVAREPRSRDHDER